jgi:hypothetical protein
MKEIKVLEGKVVAPEGMKVGIVASRFNEIIVNKLLGGAVDGLVRHGVEEENFFLIQWYPDEAAAKAKLAQLEELGDGKQYLVDFSLKRENPSSAENFGNSNPVQLRS